MRARRTTTVAVTAVALVAAAVASAGTTRYRSGPLVATMSAGTHYPNCKQLWPVRVTATYDGRPAHATAYYEFLYGGQDVQNVNVFSGTPRNPHNRLYHFYGGFYDNTFGPFGALAVNHTIVVVTVVRDGRYTAKPWYTVHVVGARGCRAVR